MDLKNIQTELFKMQDMNYRCFHAKLIPNVDPETIIGVRTPLLRKFSKSLFKNCEYVTFLNLLPHKYYEENNIHGFLIEQICDYHETISRLEQFFPYINNWATCDSICPKIFRKYPQELFLKINEWVKSHDIYAIRFAVKMLMAFYDFSESNCKIVSEIKSDNYYVNMVIAWYFATALTKQYEVAVKYLKKKKLSPWVHNKTIQKALESRRISNDIKDYLRAFRKDYLRAFRIPFYGEDTRIDLK